MAESRKPGMQYHRLTPSEQQRFAAPFELRRQHVVSMASRTIEALEGLVENVSLAGRLDEYDTSPEGIPGLTWKSTLPDPEGAEDLELDVIGNLGEYFGRTFDDEKPSDVFNAGFYAGILAVNAGLVDPTVFKPEIDDTAEQA